MSWTVEVYDPSIDTTYDITNKTLQINTQEQLGAKSNTFSIRCKLINLIHKFHTITIKEDTVIKYAGTIITQSDEDEINKITAFNCVDWSYIFTHRLIAKIYESDDVFEGRPDLIIKDMIDNGAPEITKNNIQVCNETIDFLEFQYKLMMECTKEVFDFIPDWRWYVDAEKDFHFFRQFETDGVTFGPDASTGDYNFNINSLKIEYIGDQQVNRLWIIGAKQAQSTPIDQYFDADGNERYFNLAYEPNYTNVYLNTVTPYDPLNDVLMTSKLESNDDGDQDFLINKTQKIFFIPANIATAFTGKIRINYRPTRQLIDYFENAPNISTYGLYEKAIKNKNITDRLGARQFGKAEIRRKSEQKRLVKFKTREDVTIGQRCYLNIVVSDEKKGDWNIVGYFLVRGLTTNISSVDVVRSVELEEIL